MKNEIFISKVDYRKLSSMILNFLEHNNANILELNRLNMEIKRAKLVEPGKITSKFITMNSLIEVRFSNNKSSVIKLVYPSEANLKSGHISVLSSLGCAILGYKEGESVSFKTPSGLQSVTIEKILYQPEANGEDLQ